MAGTTSQSSSGARKGSSHHHRGDRSALPSQSDETQSNSVSDSSESEPEPKKRSKKRRSGSQKRSKKKQKRVRASETDASNSDDCQSIPSKPPSPNPRHSVPKEKGSAPSKQSEYKGDFVKYGRAFVRLCYDPFSRIELLLERALVLDARDPDEVEEEENISNLSRREKALHELRLLQDKFAIKAWDHLCKYPDLKRQVFEALADQSLRNSVCAKIKKGATGSRQDDTSNCRTSSDFWQFDIKLGSPIDKSNTTKSNRGWYNDFTASQMCPIELDANAETYARILGGRIKVTARSWMRCLYPLGHIFDPLDEFSGLFYGYLPVRFARLILTGPQTMVLPVGYSARQGCNAERIGVDHMTPQLLAYIIIQMRFALCSVESWQQWDRDFDLKALYWNVVQFFDEFPQDGEKVLAYYDREVLLGMSPLANDPHEDNTGGSGYDSSEGMTAIERLREQHKQLEKARATGQGSEE